MIIRLVISGILGGLIGYFTNFIALRMLFYPRKRIAGFQGLLPRYKKSFADKFADFVIQFINYEEIIEELVDKHAFINYVDEKNWGFVRSSIGYLITSEIEHWLNSETVRRHLAKNLIEMTPKAKALLVRKIVSTNIDDLNKLILNNTTQEFKFIQRIGGVLGFVIGALEIWIFN